MVVQYTRLTKKKLKMNPFFARQFNYCPLIWMIFCHFNNTRIKILHEKCFRPIYNDKISSYEELLEHDG